MIQNNYFTENSDLLLQFTKIQDWGHIVDLYEDGFKDAETYKATQNELLAMAPATVEEAIETYRTALTSLGEIAGVVVSPHVAEWDRIGLKFENGEVTFPKPLIEAYNAVRRAGLQPYSINRKYGGLSMPCVVQVMAMEVISRVDATLAIAVGTVNLAETIERYASQELIDVWVPKLATGEVTAAMALTEPNHGSDLPGLQTKAVKGEDGVWRISGTKRFITHGCGFTDTPAVILTLARSGSPTSGARGLSFFLVRSEDVEIAGIERKLGLHCSPTCDVVFDNAPAELIGQEGMGLVKYAMGMMNTARLSIASQAMGIAAAAYFEGKKYASERVQFGRLIQEIPAVKKMLDRMERETTAMRCLLLEAALSVDEYIWKLEHLEAAGKSEKEIRADEQIRKWEKLANLFTPLSKYYLSEMCNVIASDALQIHGGAGYTEDYDVARIYRDARITNIYEGTTQLQVVAAIGGVAAGMAGAGHLREYVDANMARFKPTVQLKKVYGLFEEAVDVYKSIKESAAKDTVAFEVVEAAARFLNGMLLERSAALLDVADMENRLELAYSYHVDSEAIIAGDIIRIRAVQARQKRPTLAAVV